MQWSERRSLGRVVPDSKPFAVVSNFDKLGHVTSIHAVVIMSKWPQAAIDIILFIYVRIAPAQ